MSWNLLTEPTAKVIQDWADGLADVPDQNIRWGVKKAENIQGKIYGSLKLPEFKDLCRITPEDLGLPSTELAFTQACQATTQIAKNRLHPAVYHAAADTGWFDLRNGYARQRVFTSHYDKRVKQIMDGEELEIPKLEAIEKKSPPPLAADVIKSRCAELRKALA